MSIGLTNAKPHNAAVDKRFHVAQQVRTKQEEVDHKEEVLAVLLERYAVSGSTAVPDNPVGQSHANLGLAGPIRQGSLTALSKASLAPSTDSKGPGARPTAGDVKRLGSSRGRLDIKVIVPCWKQAVVA